MTQSRHFDDDRARAKVDDVDGAHLERMTLGDRSLEREVLEIFARQTTLTLERIAGAAPEQAAAAAHTLKGRRAELAPGAWRRRPNGWNWPPANPTRVTFAPRSLNSRP